MNYQRNPMRYPGANGNGGVATAPEYHKKSNGFGGCFECDREQEYKTDCLNGMSLAMVYSPCQSFEELYSSDEALRRGTLFRKLDKPFTGKGRGM